MGYVGEQGSAGARQRALWPGMPALPRGVERYRVAGGGAVVIPVTAGDRLIVTDVEGGQPCELVAFGSDGRADPGILGGKPTGEGAGLKASASRPITGPLLAARLAAHGLVLRDIRSADLFGPDSAFGDQAEFDVSGDGTLVAVAPGAPMSPHEQNPPTEIELRVERAARKEGAEFVLPPPLAEPRLDFRVDRATALSYEVRAGEFIQVIDVQGQQCSDLQAFTMAQLEKGIERCLDVTTTRTLMGQGYPGPGLRAKYYDQDFQPLIELIQDNCMRHDAFGLACTAKYYEELGYPGHVNCSDNFNKVLEPYQIAARRGWMAMNFFYNTGINDFNQFYLD
ncbi:MAG: DUF1989 domain-containing protein, partial [Alphaproteobacteria bacterium]|nr:DUF1989 domain-containing protein [Alphaproteobacteria bacterium]